MGNETFYWDGLNTWQGLPIPPGNTSAGRCNQVNIMQSKTALHGALTKKIG